MSGFDQYVRASSASLSLVDLLQRPVTELLGVGTDAGMPHDPVPPADAGLDQKAALAVRVKTLTKC